ncbi:MAG: NADH-quinone oxidoreductase subunit I [Spirochaetota bacterium]|nr:NADH-quinone oxidoreductase subunit I [Spirochaetota bacterium]
MNLMNEPSTQYNKRYRKMNFIEMLYLPAIAKGLVNTLRHLLRIKKFTVEYPEKKLVYADRFRGEHRLKKDEKGRIKCVACYMCATACPAKCITIVASKTPTEYGEDRDKYPKEFTINELRCIFCGYCVEACPCDAIEMTQRHPQVYGTREEFIYNREKLLNN